MGKEIDEKNKEGFLKEKMKKIDVRAYTMIAGLVLIWVMFSFLTDGAFLSVRNISNLTMQMAVIGILGTGMVLVIVTGNGNIDLSVGSLTGLMGGIAAALMVWGGWGTIPTIITVLVLGVLAGSIQGFAIVFLNVPAFIVTLGGMMVFRGVLLGITKGVSIAPMNNTYKILGQAYITDIVTYSVAAIGILALLFSAYINHKNNVKYNTEQSAKSFYTKPIIFSLLILGFVYVMNLYKGIPVPAFLMIILVVFFTFLVEKTRFGRSLYAIGGNLQAALFSGIKVKKIIFTVFVINGLMAAIAGMVLSARLNAGSASAGDMFELDAIAAAVIGGTSLTGGRGRVYGAILGALIMATLDNGMSLLNLASFWQYIVKGSVLIIAVWFDQYTKKGA